MAQFYSTPVRITMSIGPAINFLFHFLQYMILSVYWSMKLVYVLFCRRDDGAEKECWRKIVRRHAPHLVDAVWDGCEISCGVRQTDSEITQV